MDALVKKKLTFFGVILSELAHVQSEGGYGTAETNKSERQDIMNNISKNRIWKTLATVAIAMAFYTASTAKAHAWWNIGAAIYGSLRGGW